MKPNYRPEPPRVHNATNKIKSCKYQGTNTEDTSWVLLRMVSHNELPLPPSDGTQIIQFWTGFNASLFL